MLQRALQSLESTKLHVAIIMDGNGRWAQARGLPRTEGHRAGAAAVRRVIEAAPDLQIHTLTLFAFSSDNWQRPAREVWTLLRLFRHYLLSEADECVRRGIRLSVIGRRKRLPPQLCEAVETVEAATRQGRALHLRLAVDYSARDAILRAAHRLKDETEPTRERFTRLLGGEDHEGEGSADVDLLIRTGGEQRLSDFLLWESAYAELFFTGRMWPDFERADLEAAIREFHARERRFGCVTEAPAIKESLPLETSSRSGVLDAVSRLV
jgi:undecaprenyl diphosphate synthase